MDFRLLFLLLFLLFSEAGKERRYKQHVNEEQTGRKIISIRQSVAGVIEKNGILIFFGAKTGNRSILGVVCSGRSILVACICDIHQVMR